ncbi:yjeF N-terminal domain-containing 3 isoform 7-T7 [Spinachia spinachia]
MFLLFWQRGGGGDRDGAHEGLSVRTAAADRDLGAGVRPRHHQGLPSALLSQEAAHGAGDLRPGSERLHRPGVCPSPAHEYEPTIYHPQRSSQSLHQDFTVQCEKMDIPSLSYLPTEVQLINDAYNLVIDAMMGPDADCANLREPYPGILVTLKQIKIPIASVDVPSGWDVEEPSQDGINPEVLISLTAPKKCAISFSGKHFLAGRFLPYDIQKKYDLNLPEYPGTDCLIEL